MGDRDSNRSALSESALVFGLALPGSPAPDLTTPHPSSVQGQHLHGSTGVSCFPFPSFDAG
jgi:hypothetical protein